MGKELASKLNLVDEVTPAKSIEQRIFDALKDHDKRIKVLEGK